MRFMVMALLMGLVCSSVPAWADATQNPADSTRNFGRVFCTPHVPCLDDAVPAAPESLAANANACANQYFGGSRPTAFFDATAGMDSSGCLTANPNTAMTSNDGTLAPQCCVVQLSDHVCTFRCELNKQ